MLRNLLSLDEFEKYSGIHVVGTEVLRVDR